MRAAAGRLVGEIQFVKRAGRVDAPDVAVQLRMARQDLDHALLTCALLDHRARTD